MSKFTDHLWRDLVREAQPDACACGDRPKPGRAPSPVAFSRAARSGWRASARRSWLALGHGSAAPPAFAITTNGDGSALVTHQPASQSLPAANS